MQPDIEFIKKWVGGLEREEVEQTHGLLHDAYGFCCLGFACHLADPNNWKQTNRYQGGPVCYEFNNERFNLLPEMTERLGLSEEIQTKLMCKNDGNDGENVHTFPEIAAYLKREVYTYINFNENAVNG